MQTYVNPTSEQFGAMMKSPSDEPVHMLNMLRFRAAADYPADHPNAKDGLDGAGAYKLYGATSAPIFKRVGGSMVSVWEPKNMVIGPSDEVWDRIFVAAYPSVSAFGEMLKDPDYQKAVVHRTAAIETSRLIRMAPRAVTAGFAGDA